MAHARPVDKEPSGKRRPSIYSNTPGRLASAAEAKREAFWNKRSGFTRRDFFKVYFIQDHTGAIKIGIAEYPALRLGSLQVAHPHPLKLLGVCEGGRRLERELHEAFSHNRLSGEWYRPSEGLLRRIGDLTETAGEGGV